MLWGEADPHFGPKWAERLARDIPGLVALTRIALTRIPDAGHLAMAAALDTLAGALPATCAYDALDTLAVDGALGSRGTADVAVVIGLTAAALIVAAATLQRRTT